MAIGLIIMLFLIMWFIETEDIISKTNNDSLK